MEYPKLDPEKFKVHLLKLQSHIEKWPIIQISYNTKDSTRAVLFKVPKETIEEIYRDIQEQGGLSD